MSREQSIARFLERHGYAIGQASPLAQDASFRRYLRLGGGPRPAVLMDAPPPEDVRPFLRIAAHLGAIGLSVPEIVAAEAETGLAIEEDLGDDLFPVAAVAPETLFDTAVDALVAMQRAAPPAALPRWGVAEMIETALGASAPQEARGCVGEALTAMLEPVATGPIGFVHRDFFAGNLLWLPSRTGLRRAGIIDFQGAALGHPAYDLVSLLQDSRRENSPTIEIRELQRYLDQRPDLDPVAFRAAYAACAAQRHLRVACQWVRLARRDGRPGYLAFGPRTWHLLNETLTHPVAAPLAAALERWVPTGMRGNPPGIAA